MTKIHLPSRHRGLLLSGLIFCAVIAPPSASALTAPGRVTVPFMSGDREGVDPFALAGVAVMADGRIVTSGINAHTHRLLLTRETRTGAPDPSFGSGGLVSLDVPHEQGTYGPYPSGPQLAADGSVYVSGRGPSPAKFEGAQTVITHVLTDGRPDAAFGSGGSAISGVEDGSIALTGDGRVLVAGQVGRYDLSTFTNIGDTTTAVVARLTPTGALDASFGSAGIVTLPGSRVVAVVSLPDGGVAVTTAAVGTSRLIELSPNGSVVPAFDHGAPLVLSGFPDGLLARPDGTADVLVTDARRMAAALVRVRPDGTGDPSFGSGGAVSATDGTLIPGPAGSDLVTGIGSFEPPAGQPFTVTIHRILGDGTPDPLYGAAAGRSFAMAFGGGYATSGAIHVLPRVSSLDQTGFRGGAVAVRPGGGFVVAGAAAVIQYTGEGEGSEHEDVALAAYGADLGPDASFGGPAAAPRVSFSLPRQQAATDGAPNRRYVLARLTVSTPGLCQISVRTRGVVVAKADVPVFSSVGENAHVWLTGAGRRLLPHARHATATARATCEDLVGTRTAVPAIGLLR